MRSDSLISRALTWRYMAALTLVAMLSTAAWLSLHLVIANQKSSAAVVNISGRQRMLSQRTALFSSLLVNASREDRPAIRRQLQEAADLMQRSHRGLIHGDADLGLPDTMSATVRAMYFEPPLALDKQVEDYLATVRTLLGIPDQDLGLDQAALRYVIEVSPSLLVSSLDKMVSQYQLEGETAVSRLQTAETVVWLVTLMLLVLEAAFIFQPFARQLRVVIGKLHGVTEHLRQSQDELEERVSQRTEELEQRTKELADSEEKFRLISTSAQDAILIIDQMEAITYWNPAATAMFSYTAEQALGRNMHDLLAPPRYRENIHHGFTQFRHTGTGPIIGKTLELTALRQGGEEFPIELSISTLLLNGQVHALGIIRDISERKQVEEELRQTMAFTKTLIDSLPGVFFRLDSAGRLVGWNKALETLLGAEGLALAQTNAIHVIQEDDKASVADKIREGFEQGLADTEARLILKDGSTPYFYFIARSLTIDNQPYLLGTGVDIGERKAAEARLQLAASVLTHAREGISITDADGTIVEVNEAFTRITGYSRAEALGQNPRILKSDRQSPEYYAAMWQALIEAGYWSGEVWNRRKNGEVYAEILTISAVRDATGRTQNYVALFTDITPMKEHQQRLEHIAHYDPLTDLPNRVLLSDRLGQAMAQSLRRNRSLAVVYLDLDGFKSINDHHGHDAGDAFLITVAQRMKRALREGDTLARIGGDEFIAVLVDLDHTREWEPVLDRLLQAAATPAPVGNAVLQVSASIGVTLYPQDGVDADQLVRHADHAMYQAKLSGKNRYHLFDADRDGL